MPRLPARFAAVIVAFAPLFVRRSWRHAEVLLLGAVLAPGRRTVTSLLRITGLGRERHFVNYHRVLNRAVWSARAGSRELLGMLLDAFASRGPVVLAIDDTIERRRGKRIQAKGIYRDPVRSSDAHFVKASGLRWISLMLLAPIPWAGRVWALPFLTALAPSERFCRERGRRHKRLTDWGRHHGGLPVVPMRWVLVRDPEHRFGPQALLCTDLDRDPEQIVRWFVRRWRGEVTFQETRTHLGIETQRQWSEKALARTTPCLLALFSIVTLLAAQLSSSTRRRVSATAWYRKPHPTFSDALASVRREIWREQGLLTSGRRGDRTKCRFALPAPWSYALCQAA